MATSEMERLLRSALCKLQHEEHFDHYLNYLNGEWFYTADDLRLAQSNDSAWQALKLPTRLKIELAAQLYEGISLAKSDDGDKVEQVAAHDEGEEDEDIEVLPAPSDEEGKKTVAIDAVDPHEALEADNWVKCYSHENGCYYYYNLVNAESRWECPDQNRSYEVYMYSEEAQDWVVATEQDMKGLPADTEAGDYLDYKGYEDEPKFSRPRQLNEKSEVGKGALFVTSPRYPPDAAKGIASNSIDESEDDIDEVASLRQRALRARSRRSKIDLHSVSDDEDDAHASTVAAVAATGVAVRESKSEEEEEEEDESVHEVVIKNKVQPNNNIVGRRRSNDYSPSAHSAYSNYDQYDDGTSTVAAGESNQQVDADGYYNAQAKDGADVYQQQGYAYGEGDADQSFFEYSLDYQSPTASQQCNQPHLWASSSTYEDDSHTHAASYGTGSADGNQSKGHSRYQAEQFHVSPERGQQQQQQYQYQYQAEGQDSSPSRYIMNYDELDVPAQQPAEPSAPPPYNPEFAGRVEDDPTSDYFGVENTPEIIVDALPAPLELVVVDECDAHVADDYFNYQPSHDQYSRHHPSHQQQYEREREQQQQQQQHWQQRLENSPSPERQDLMSPAVAMAPSPLTPFDHSRHNALRDSPIAQPKRRPQSAAAAIAQQQVHRRQVDQQGGYYLVGHDRDSRPHEGQFLTIAEELKAQQLQQRQLSHTGHLYSDDSGTFVADTARDDGTIDFQRIALGDGYDTPISSRGNSQPGSPTRSRHKKAAAANADSPQVQFKALEKGKGLHQQQHQQQRSGKNGATKRLGKLFKMNLFGRMPVQPKTPPPAMQSSPAPTARGGTGRGRELLSDGEGSNLDDDDGDNVYIHRKGKAPAPDATPSASAAAAAARSGAGAAASGSSGAKQTQRRAQSAGVVRGDSKSAAAAAERHLAQTMEHRRKVKKLVEMGFNNTEVIMALNMCDDDLQEATAMLLERSR